MGKRRAAREETGRPQEPLRQCEPWAPINRVIISSPQRRLPPILLAAPIQGAEPRLEKTSFAPFWFLSFPPLYFLSGRQVRKAGNLFVPLCLPNADQETHLGRGRQPPRSGRGSGGDAPAVQPNRGEGGSWGTRGFSSLSRQTSIPASQPRGTWRTDLASPEPFRAFPSRQPRNAGFSLLWLCKSQASLWWFC